MIRALIAIAILFAAVFGLDWLGTVPVSIAIEWPGGAATPPARMAVVALVVFAVVAVLLWKVVSALFHGPGAVRGFFRGRRRDRGYNALSRGMIAVGSGDVRLAHRFAREAGRILPREPLVQLLEAQTAQLEGRSDDARGAFTRMLDNPDTRLLGLRGLFIEANRSGEAEAARHFAAEAQKLAPGVPWAGTAMMEYQSSEQDWAGALKTLEQNTAARLVDKAESRRLRAVLLTARALDGEEIDPDRARGYALEAHRLVPDFVPAAVVAARLLTRLLDNRKAAKVIETTWKANPHPDLVDVYLHVRTGDSARDRLKRARTLEQLRPHHVEGAIAVARAAIDARDFDLARASLAKALRQAPTQRVCLMMAELEETESGDIGRIREWLARAVRAPRDEAWTADGVVAETWHPASPVTGRIDAFEWRVPVNVESGATELDGSELAERAVRPLAPPPDDDAGPSGPGPTAPSPAGREPVPALKPDTAPIAAAAVAEVPRDAVPPSPPSAPSVAPVAAAGATPTPGPAPAAPAPSLTSPASPAPEPRRAEFPIPFRPDDPGTRASGSPAPRAEAAFT